MKIIYVFFCSVLIFCCKINQNFKNDFSKDDDTLSFSLRSPDYKQCPVICIHDSGKDFYFNYSASVSTGAMLGLLPILALTCAKISSFTFGSLSNQALVASLPWATRSPL